MRERGRHPSRDRLIAVGAEQWVEPYQSVRHPAQAGQLDGQQLGVSSVPAIAHENDDGAVAEHASGPAAVEFGQRLADPGAAAEVVDRLADLSQGTVDVTPAQYACDPGQPRGKDERLDVLPTSDRVGEYQQQPGVAFHRATDVAQQDQWPAAQPSLAMKQPDQFAAGTDGVAGRAPEVDTATEGRRKAAGTALRDPAGRRMQKALELLRLMQGQVFEVFVTQQLFRAVAGAAAGHALFAGLARDSRAVHAQCLQPRSRALGRKRQGSAPARNCTCPDPRVRGSPEDVKGGLEKGELVLAADEASPQAVAESGLVAELDLGQGACRRGQASGPRIQPGVVQQPRKGGQPGQQVRSLCHCRAQPTMWRVLRPGPAMTPGGQSKSEARSGRFIARASSRAVRPLWSPTKGSAPCSSSQATISELPPITAPWIGAAACAAPFTSAPLARSSSAITG